MIITSNITNTIWDLQRYKNAEDMEAFCIKHGLDGFEVLLYENQELGILPPHRVKGLHLTYDNAWIDFWNGDEAGICEEYDTLEKAQDYLGKDKVAMIKRYEKQLDFAESLGVSYVVFHVTDISTKETLTYERKHSDEAVIKASLELINQLLEDKSYHFDFLVENLWWAGFDFLSPQITRDLLESIHYEHKGVMLDTGHLMHTNLELRTEDEAIDYIIDKVKAHGDLKKWIKGLHLQQSLTGHVVKKMLKEKPYQEGMTYEDRMAITYPYVFKIDSHMPFTTPKVRQLIEMINPDYLTHEFISISREEHEAKIEAQRKALGDK